MVACMVPVGTVQVNRPVLLLMLPGELLNNE
jgi:hypothetical protein